MSYLENNRDELMEEADNRKRDIAEGWIPPYQIEEKIKLPKFEMLKEVERTKPGIEEGSLEDVNPDIEEIPPMTELFY